MPILLPKVSSMMEEGQVVQWLVLPGKQVAKDEAIALIECDKAVVEIPMPHDGILERFLVEAGTTVAVGTPIALLEGEEEFSRSTPLEGISELAESQVSAAHKPEKSPTSFIAVSPAARRRARELAIDLSCLHGTGPGGRIIYRDIEHANQPARPSDSTQQHSPVETLSPMRLTIARRMEESITTIPQFSMTYAADLSSVLTIKTAIQNSLSQRGIKLSLTDFIVRATAETLQEHPDLNASFIGSPRDERCHIKKHASANAGLAVAVEGGLTVPVIHEAERLTVAEIATERVLRLEGLRRGTCPGRYLKGGTFTISNLGAFGVQQFQAIVNPPEAFILAVGAVSEEVVAREGKMEIRPLMRITGTFDHRVVDGAPAAAFMRDLVRRMESREWALF